MTTPAHTRKPRPARGPFVAATLLALCAAGFLATVWNYSRNHPMSVEARLLEPGPPAVVEAVFAPDAAVAPGHRVVVRIEGDSRKARGGIVDSISDDMTALILVADGSEAPAGSAATVSVDGTLPPIGNPADG